MLGNSNIEIETFQTLSKHIIVTENINSPYLGEHTNHKTIIMHIISATVPKYTSAEGKLNQL